MSLSVLVGVSRLRLRVVLSNGDSCVSRIEILNRLKMGATLKGNREDKGPFAFVLST